MFYLLIDENNKVIGFQPSTTRLVEVDMDELPKPPEHPKPGINCVQYYNQETKKIELREESRPLTLEERVAAAENKADASMEAIVEMYEQGNR